MPVKVEIRSVALGEIARSAEVGADMDRRARAVAAAAGTGYRAVGGAERRRERASVITATRQARYDNARHATLLRALDAARD